jgi:ABC-type Zn uptake system ZnuABC Zn-binding protein ZnuA
MKHPLSSMILCLLCGLFWLSACVNPDAGLGETVSSDGTDRLPLLAAVPLQPDEKLRVVASTTLIADAVTRIGGNVIELTVLLPPGADPHGYQPPPDDLRAISDAHLVFVNGLGLEESLASILYDAKAKTVSVNVGVETIAFGDREDAEHRDGPNPHTWWSIRAVERWIQNIAAALAAVDSAHQAQYEANAATYRTELEKLRVELENRMVQLPPAQRKLATDHATLAYFARDFGFQVVGLVVPSLSTLAEPSAQHLAELQDRIRMEGVRTIFVGSTVNPRLAEQLALDLGIRVLSIFTDSLSAVDGPTPNYIEFMRYNSNVIINGLLDYE